MQIDTLIFGLMMGFALSHVYRLVYYLITNQDIPLLQTKYEIMRLREEADRLESKNLPPSHSVDKG